MANYNMPAADNVRMIIDFDDDELDRVFVVEHDDGAGVIKPLWSVNEAGRVMLFGELKRAFTSPTFNETTGTGDIARFMSAGSAVKAKVDKAGRGVLAYGLRLPRNTGPSDPNTAGLAGSPGDLLIWHNGGTGKDEIWCCNPIGVNTWNKATHV